MNTSFEDRLLSELKREVALAVAEERERAPARRRLLTPARAGLGLAGAAVAATALVVLPGGTSTPAYAVEQTGDGGIVVHISDWPQGEQEVTEFAQTLRDAGVAIVYNPPEGYLCRPFPGGSPSAPPEELPPLPPGVDTVSLFNFAGGATAIAPRVAGATVPGDGASVEEPSTTGTEEDFAYELQEGDTVILTEIGGAGSIAFIEGACDPVPDSTE
ncbi:hypothetical protein [Streptomyces sp. NBC_01803]|uniref:hypothetical protein n=1 Tax=Streptomyces sp. NBC_01803 TaxID=2975946 RepID=UPI002DDAFADC|nr:hypothetical protein [Streptomyces sp. NBC_01803]WSA43642.1 hypothetical protein OIE51_05135 [Streptomyces sp. NBC_01803]